jgi:hypothetical protein
VNLRLWCALLAGHIAWSLHLMVSYYLASVACVTGESGQQLVLRHAVTLIAALVLIGAAGLAWPAWRQAARGEMASIPRTFSADAAPPNPGAIAETTPDDPAPQRCYLARVTFPLNGMLLFATLAAGAVNFFLVPCA